MTHATATNPDALLHVFSTFCGIAPDSDTPPVCGAALTAAYNGAGRPKCRTCAAILAKARRKAAK